MLNEKIKSYNYKILCKFTNIKKLFDSVIH